MTLGVDELGIGARVRASRERIGLSREALAYHSGISWSAIAQVESGRRTNLRPGTLGALARTLRVTIDYLVSGRAPTGPMLEHHALLYDTDDDFLSAAADFLGTAAERSEPALVVTSRPRIRELRGALGERTELIEFADHAKWHRSPTAALAGYRQFLEKSIAGGASWVRILGEPVWAGGEDGVRAWSRCESLMNLVFSSSPLSLLCSYARQALDAEVLQHACATHPHTLERGDLHPSPAFCDPVSYILEPSA